MSANEGDLTFVRQDDPYERLTLGTPGGTISLYSRDGELMASSTIEPDGSVTFYEVPARFYSDLAVTINGTTYTVHVPHP